MTRTSLAGWSLTSGFLLLAVVFGLRALDRPSTPRAHTASVRTVMGPSPDAPFGASADVPASDDLLDPDGGVYRGLLHGRVTTVDGVVYEGRLRFGGDEEALWSHYFNGFRAENPWKAYVPEEALTAERPVELFGVRLGTVTRDLDLRRPFMVRFGDMARIDAGRRLLEVTLRSGAVVRLDRYSADDFADGVRVWDAEHGEVTLGEWRVRSIEFMPAPGATGKAGGTPTGPATAVDPVPAPLHGTVHTRAGEFTGLIQWDREEALQSDLLRARDGSGAVVTLPFANIRSIARRGDAGIRDGGIRVTLRDGGGRSLAYSSEGGLPHRGIYVDDARYGRVLVSWDAFERLDFSRGVEGAGTGSPGSATPAFAGPGYTDFAAGRVLSGTVTTRSGERFEGHLVYDLDESETIETLDAPRHGVDYTIPFRLVASIVPAGADAAGGNSGGGSDAHGMATVTLRGGEVLRLEASGDLGEGHAGVLIAANADRSSTWVPWAEVARIEFESTDPPSSETAPAASRE